MEADPKELYTPCFEKVFTTRTQNPWSIFVVDSHSNEEVQARMLLQVAYAASQGLKKMILRTVDTDAIVIANVEIQHITLGNFV